MATVSQSGEPDSEMQAVFWSEETPAGNGLSTTTAKVLVVVAPAARVASVSEHVEPAAAPEQLQPEELWALDQVVELPTVSWIRTLAASWSPVFCAVRV
jgi:hypothetical protein